VTSARSTARDDQILAALRNRSVPLTTREICGELGHHRYSSEGLQTYRRLHSMACAGRLERWRVDGWPEVSWSASQ
jgi:hypothetical protein